MTSSCPKERIFLDGETPFAAVFAHSLGLWERLGGLAHMADGADSWSASPSSSPR